MAGEKLILNADPPPTVTDVAPVIATVIRSQPSAIPSGTIAHTPGVAPNVIVQVVQPIAAILVPVRQYVFDDLGRSRGGRYDAGGRGDSAHVRLRASPAGLCVLVIAGGRGGAH